MIALRPTDSRDVFSAKALNSWDNSSTKFFSGVSCWDLEAVFSPVDNLCVVYMRPGNGSNCRRQTDPI